MTTLVFTLRLHSTFFLSFFLFGGALWAQLLFPWKF
jgi:hypothetical protein